MSLQVRNLSKHWQQTKAVDQITFSVSKGEFVALLGPSGCGKSTTLKMIAGLESPTSGEILLDNQNITPLAPGRRGLSMVFQSYALFPHLNVRENILFGLKARRVRPEEQSRRLEHVADLVDLGSHLEKKPSQLSGGQCQRVALARAIVAQASLCLMDEPLSNLDAKLRHEMRAEIRSLQQRLGMTVLYVTHDQVEAMSMADRILLIHEGRLVQSGSPEQLYGAPASTFAARFIGNPPMNLLQTENGFLGIRPEHVRCEPGGMQANVVRCDYHGADTIIDATLPAYGMQVIRLRVAGHQILPADCPLSLRWQPEHEHHFCARSGVRLQATVSPVFHTTLTKETNHVANR